MTEDTTKLIKEARSYFLPGDEGSIEWRTVEALASLVAENEKLRREIEFKRARVKGAVSDYEAECTRADRAEAERDAAQRIIESHTCGENVELAYRRTLDAQKERDALRAQLDTIRAIVNDWHVPTFSERHYGSHAAVVKIENAHAAYSPTSEETR